MKKELPKDRASSKTWFIGLAVWFILVVLFFAPATIGGKVIAPIDCVECVFRPFAHRPIEEVHNQFIVDGASQYVPHKWALKEQWETDGYMGWNPYVHNGTASPENTMYSPGDWHNFLFAIMPFWDAWNVGIVLQFFIAGCGMILLLRHFGVPMWVALLAAISFSFYSQFIICLYYRWLGSFVWAPYLVWALIRYKQNIVNVPAILFMALAWRGGHMQSCLFLFTLVACMWVAEVWKKEGKWPGLKAASRTTLSYFLTGSIGALLSLDVFVDTLPRMEGCKPLAFSYGVNNIVTFLTSLFPNVFGLPQTVDVLKGTIGYSLFDIKFGGAIVFIIALIACFNPRAPRVAKFLFVIIAIAVCTPLCTYLYSRGTVVMALGMAWLAAWQLYDFTRHQYSTRFWKKVGYAIIGVAVLWTMGSVLIVCYREQLTDMLNEAVIHNSSTYAQIGRRAWYFIRVERFLSSILIWNWQNAVLLIGLLLGLFCCSRIKVGNARSMLWMIGVVAVTFIELCVFSYSWLAYGERTDGPYPYEAPKWLPELKKHVRDGAVTLCRPVVDSDFLCTNHFLVYGIRMAIGYETVQPKYLHPLSGRRYDTKDYAMAGISHVLMDTKWKDDNLPEWTLVMQTDEFKLFENPEYVGRYLVDAKGIKENWRTCSRIHFTIPAGAKTLTVLESYHRGWKAYAGGTEVEVTKNERGGMVIQLPSSDKPYDLLMEFHMPYRALTYGVMLLVALFLVVEYRRQKKNRVCNGGESI